MHELHRTAMVALGHRQLTLHSADPRGARTWTVVYLAPGQAALGNIVCRQDPLSPAWSGPLQQGGRLEGGVGKKNVVFCLI